MSIIEGKGFIITIQTELWDNDKYLDRITREKGKPYTWPGVLPDDQSHYLPYGSYANEKIIDLKPGAKITINKILYDALKTFRPGRFQCVEATAHTDQGDKQGFIWVIYQGKTFITPELSKGLKKHKFQIVNRKSKELILQKTDTIEINYIDKETQEPIMNIGYIITLENGTSIRGNLDEKGYAQIENIPPGNHKIRFE